MKPTSDKIVDWEELEGRIEEARRKEKRIVFTNGCFDLLHAGHVAYLEAARSLGDLLVVGVNTDRSVRNIKGPARPVTPQHLRAKVVAALAFVDLVTLFDEPDPLNLILKVRPHILVKGADWPLDRIVGRKEVESWGGRVARIPLEPGLSTTSLIHRIRNLPPQP